MQYVECPNLEPPQYKSVYLAGGITGCPDWQSEMVRLLKNEYITILNPRRKIFSVYDQNTIHEQIYWEYLMLRQADLISFYFPKETLCPIVLFELGSWLNTNKPIVIGIDPNYKRKLDVEIQTRLVRQDLKICYTLDELGGQILYKIL
jgi:hypothetical protein